MVEKIKSIAAVLLLSCAVFIQGDLVGSAGESAVRPVRVLVLRDVKNAEMTVQGKFTLIDEERPLILEENVEGLVSDVFATAEGISIHGKVYKTRRLAIEPKGDASIAINKRRFRGHITIFATPRRTLNIINVVDLEQYIKGVLYHEISHRWPIEAIKAQAVATRTYALYAMQQNGGRDYDVTNDIYSQVYGGRNSERFRTGLAVEATKGQVLIYDGKILPAFFHATCAGMTEDVSEVWNLKLPPLQSVVCPYCQHSPHMRWKRNFRLKDIQEKLNDKGHKIGLIKDITVVRRNKSDRIDLLRITGRSGDSITVSGKDFRSIIGPNDIRSNNYEIVMKGYFVDIYGRGWGHGVGLCQWGAFGMAQKEFTYKEILKQYYPGARMVRLDDLNLNL